jgi:hypothetical protein
MKDVFVAAVEPLFATEAILSPKTENPPASAISGGGSLGYGSIC